MRVEVLTPVRFRSAEEALAFGRLLVALAERHPRLAMFHRKRSKRMAGK